MKTIKICILCKKEFTEYGNNPWPLASYDDGQCCDHCDCLKVLPERLKQMGYSIEQGKELGEWYYKQRNEIKFPPTTETNNKQ